MTGGPEIVIKAGSRYVAFKDIGVYRPFLDGDQLYIKLHYDNTALNVGLGGVVAITTSRAVYPVSRLTVELEAK